MLQQQTNAHERTAVRTADLQMNTTTIATTTATPTPAPAPTPPLQSWRRRAYFESCTVCRPFTYLCSDARHRFIHPESFSVRAGQGSACNVHQPRRTSSHHCICCRFVVLVVFLCPVFFVRVRVPAVTNWLNARATCERRL